MTPTDFRAWMARLDLDRRKAAEALGLTKRTIDGYLSLADPHPIPRTVELLCGYVERDREAARQRAALGALRALLTETPA